MVGENPQDLSQLLFIGNNANDAQSYNASLTRHQLKHSKHGETHYYSDVIYHIELNGLKPGTRYHYRCLLLEHDVDLFDLFLQISLQNGVVLLSISN